MKIEEIDTNLRVEKTLGRDDLVFLDIRKEPFCVYGLYDYKNGGEFIRMPKDVAAATSAGVDALNLQTAGGRVRFSTDAPVIALRCKFKWVTRFPHMPLTGTTGFDLYRHSDGQDIFVSAFVPPFDTEHGYESLLYTANAGEMRQYTVHFPMYNDVETVEIGLPADAQLTSGVAYRDIPPIVFYGSSITQGACASRPGNAYDNIISQRMNIDHINLGFSGSAKGEDAIRKYIAGLNMSAFVLDYDYNAPDADYLRQTHEPLYKAVRASQPDLPIIMLSKPSVRPNADSIARREVILETYNHALEKGDKKVRFLDGHTLFSPELRECSSVDNCHPSDAGFACMAKAVGTALKEFL